MVTHITIVNQQYTDNYTVSLTDQKSVWAQRKFRKPKTALNYVAQLQALGHKTAATSEATMVELLQKSEAIIAK